ATTRLHTGAWEGPLCSRNGAPAPERATHGTPTRPVRTYTRIVITIDRPARPARPHLRLRQQHRDHRACMPDARRARLSCANCGTFVGWVPQATARWLTGIVTKFGAPSSSSPISIGRWSGA